MKSGAKQKPEPERSRRGRVNRTSWIYLASLALLLMTASARPAHAQTATVQVLFTFCSGNSCPDGESPFGSLVQGLDGNLYGTTAAGGASGQGTVFRITPSGSLITLYSFCSQLGCSDGESPQANLILGTDGNFYGTTTTSGSGGGTLFRITPAGTLTTLATFTGCNQVPCGPSTPVSALVQGTDGNFYGTSSRGGTTNSGTIFQITPSGTLTVLYNFCSQTNCPDGSAPFAGLVEGTDGNFYGTTAHGGNSTGDGTVFKITPAGALTTLYSFCAQLANCPDGSTPTMPLVLGKDGNFYGTTSIGNNSGTIFKITPTGTLTTIFRLCPEGFPCATTGTVPSWLFQASDGNFYGTTQSGGTNNSGIIFQITPAGAFTNLFSFPPESPFGETPVSPPIQASDGNFYGTTTGGGVGIGQGTVYQLIVPGLSATVPSVVGLAQATADADITAAGLLVGTVTQQSSNTVPGGDVISQSPVAGVSVPINSAVNLIISTGPAVTLTSIAVTPANPTINVSTTLQFIATGTFSDGSTQNLTTSVAWATVSSSVATISNASGSQGLATAVAVGQTMVLATSGSVSGSTILTVTTSTGPPPVSITDNETIIVSDAETFPDVADNEPITISDAVSVAALTLNPPIGVAAPVAYFSAGSPLGFNSQSQAQQTLAISNIGQSGTVLMLGSVTISSGAQFTLSTLTCFNGATSTTIPSGGFCTVTITYTGTAPTTDTGALLFTDNAALSNLPSAPLGSNYTQSITLTGSGAASAPPAAPPAVVPSPDNENITVTDTAIVLACVPDVSSQFGVSHTTPFFYPNGTAQEKITLTNKGATAVGGPIYVMVSSSNLPLANATGATACNAPETPYRQVASSTFTLGAGQSLTFALQFQDFGHVVPLYSITTLAGSGTP